MISIMTGPMTLKKDQSIDLSFNYQRLTGRVQIVSMVKAHLLVVISMDHKHWSLHFFDPIYVGINIEAGEHSGRREHPYAG